jgi:ABC-type Mn2+/Zn2+ transport system permease subunit
MAEFIQTFQFVFIPFLVMAAFASILPAAGCALYIRNEMMLAIALPPLTGAALTLGVLVGISPESHIALLVVAFIITFAVVILIGSLRLSEIRRQIALASLFAGGSVMIHLCMSISPHANAHLGFLLTGELLALDKMALLQSSLLCLFSWVAFLLFRQAVYSYCIDEEMMRLRSDNFSLFSGIYRLIVVALMSASVLFIGPLLTSALLIFPPLLADMRRNSIVSFFTLGIVVALIGATGGFMAGVAMDIPPAYTASITIPIIGIALKIGGWAYSLAKQQSNRFRPSHVSSTNATHQ